MNPQYRVVIGGTNAVDLHIQAVFPKEVSALIYLVRLMNNNEDEDRSTPNPNAALGGRVDCVDDKTTVALSSEAYRPGFVYCKGSIGPGL
jgi:hypothetical protein